MVFKNNFQADFDCGNQIRINLQIISNLMTSSFEDNDNMILPKSW